MSETALDPIAILPTGAPAKRGAGAKAVYFALLREREGAPGEIDELARAASRSFLSDRLGAASLLPSDLPEDVRSLGAWVDAQSARAGRDYQAYLGERAGGAPRRYFRTRSHALHFLKAVAPTKLVDGAWLYGLLRQWADPRFAALIRIYLEELGEGRAAKNHVVLYRQLVAAHGLEGWDALGDEFFTQGAIQLALAHHAGEFLPEAIGFNLGYEQLPLHLLISAHELAELDIDPYYFTLHITVDNAASGHGRRSLAGLLEAMPRLGDPRAFYRRVVNGYRLNLLGVGTVDAIDAFDAERELVAVLARKAVTGSQLHSNVCRIEGKTVNEWLAEPAGMADFLAALQARGWIKRGEDAGRSRFWQLLQGDRAPMFGVFTAYEQQLLRDWIEASDGAAEAPPPVRRHPLRRPAHAAPTAHDDTPPPVVAASGATLAEIVAGHAGEAADREFGAELRLLVRRLEAAAGEGDAMELLIAAMSPASHHLPAGLLATRVFTTLFARPA